MRELSRNYEGEVPNSAQPHTIQKSMSRKRLVRRLTVFLIFALTVVVSLSVTFHKQAAVVEGKQKEIVKLKKEMSELQAEERVLQDEIAKLNDDEYIAKIARRDYFFSKKGETIFPVNQP